MIKDIESIENIKFENLMSEQQFNIVQQFASINSFALATLYLEDKYLILDKEKVLSVNKDIDSVKETFKRLNEEGIDIGLENLTIISPMKKHEDIWRYIKMYEDIKEEE